MNPQDSGAEVLSTRRTRRKEILLVLKKGGDVPTFEKARDRAIGDKADLRSLVPKRTLAVRDIGDQCRLYKRFGSVLLTEAVTRSLLGLGKLRVGWAKCRIREHVEVARCFWCQ